MCIRDSVNVEQVLGHAPHEISGGQKQRVALGGVMVGDVDILLFDEPLANLDPATGKQAICLIDEIQKHTGCAVIIIEHRVEDVLYRPVDRIVLMEDGRIRFDGSPDALLSTDLLPQGGIREPLYVTALKYAGVILTADMRPSYLPELVLSDSQKEQVCHWFASQPPAPTQPEKPVQLQVKNLDFTYSGGHHALRGISLEDVYKRQALAAPRQVSIKSPMTRAKTPRVRRKAYTAAVSPQYTLMARAGSMNTPVIIRIWAINRPIIL